MLIENTLLINRFSTLNEYSFMRTNKIIETFYNKNETVIFKDEKLIVDKECTNECHVSAIDQPKLIRVNGDFVEMKKDFNISDNNILGNNDLFIIKDNSNKDNSNTILIPIEKCENKYLSYYGAKLINEGDCFCLENKTPISLYQMEIGEEYVKYYLLNSNYGNGFYIEHHDLPHFHQPMDSFSKGYIILAKKFDSFFELTAFKIPYKKALFLPPFVYHSDAFLIGNYNVIYGKTEIYNTYIFKNTNDDIVNVDLV